MTLTEKISKFLQTDEMVCVNDRKPLQWGYLKMATWPQYRLGGWKWFKQFFFGDNRVMRFCDYYCFLEFTGKGRLKEIAKK